MNFKDVSTTQSSPHQQKRVKHRFWPSKFRVIVEIYSTPCISFHKLGEKQQTDSWNGSLFHFSKPMIRLQFACPVSKQSCYWLICWVQRQEDHTFWGITVKYIALHVKHQQWSYNVHVNNLSSNKYVWFQSQMKCGWVNYLFNFGLTFSKSLSKWFDYNFVNVLFHKTVQTEMKKKDKGGVSALTWCFQSKWMCCFAQNQTQKVTSSHQTPPASESSYQNHTSPAQSAVSSDKQHSQTANSIRALVTYHTRLAS